MGMVWYFSVSSMRSNLLHDHDNLRQGYRKSFLVWSASWWTYPFVFHQKAPVFESFQWSWGWDARARQGLSRWGSQRISRNSKCFGMTISKSRRETWPKGEVILRAINKRGYMSKLRADGDMADSSKLCRKRWRRHKTLNKWLSYMTHHWRKTWKVKRKNFLVSNRFHPQPPRHRIASLPFASSMYLKCLISILELTSLIERDSGCCIISSPSRARCLVLKREISNFPMLL